MTKLNLRWMFKEPNKEVEEKNFEITFSNPDGRGSTELKLAQGLVKGYVEVVWIGGDVKGLVNEEAMYNPEFKPNCGFLGNIIFVREVVTKDDAWFGSLTDDDVRKIKAWTVVHANDVHPGSDSFRLLTGEAAENYRRRLFEHQKRQQEQWDSF